MPNTGICKRRAISMYITESVMGRPVRRSST